MGQLRALLLAPPGAGKGTQGERLAKIYDVPHLATGEMLREHVARGTPVGQTVKDYLDQGELVPDEIVSQQVLERISDPPVLDGFVLDGFPRTRAQAEAAYEWGSARDRTFDAVIFLKVSDDEIVRRLLQRGRPDDTEETIRHRLAVYEKNTKPLLDFYESRGILFDVDGTGDVDEVTERVLRVVEPIVGPPR